MRLVMRSKLAMSLMVIGVSAQVAKETPSQPYQNSEAYEVYAAILATERPQGDMLLIADATVSFNSCLESRSDKLVDSAIDDYKKINKARWQLGYHLAIRQPCKLLSAKEADALLQPDKSTGAWHLDPDH